MSIKLLLLSLLRTAFKLADLAIWAYVILSWVARSNPKLWDIYRELSRIIEPILAPIRKITQPIAYKTGLDFAPYLLAILLSAAYRLVANLIYYL